MAEVRNIGYKHSREKIASQFALYECVGMDIVWLAKKPSHSSKKLLGWRPSPLVTRALYKYKYIYIYIYITLLTRIY